MGAARGNPLSGRQSVTRGERAMKGLAGARACVIAGPAIGLYVSSPADRRRSKWPHRDPMWIRHRVTTEAAGKYNLLEAV